MAIALTTATALALAGLLAVSVDGFLVSSAIRSAAPAAGHLVTRHVGYSIPTVLLSLFSQSMVLFYFIGTGRLVKDEIASYPEADRRVLLRALARFKAKTSPPATFSLLTAIAVFVLGGAVHTRALPPWTHLAASAAAIATHAWAIAAEGKTFGENYRLMADPRAYARKRAT